MAALETINKVEIQGRIGTIKIQPVGDTSVARFTVATNEYYRNGAGESIIETTWHSVEAWQGNAIDTSALEKGTAVNVTGRIVNIKYTGADGQTHYYSRIKATKVKVLA